jgi:hypothetical protein
VSSTCFEHPSFHTQEDFIHDRSFTTCMSRRAQFGRRTSFERRMWFIESHIVLVIFFLLIDLFIHLYLIKKTCCYPAKQPNHFPVKYHSHLTCIPSHSSPTALLSHRTACVRYLLLTVSSFESLSAHNPSYPSPTVLQHTLTV